jgi:GcrA cell cycle regulator
MAERGAWQPMHVQHATRLWRDGLSASDIAKVLTEKFEIKRTRNSVIGKLDRLGLLGNRLKVSRRAQFFRPNVAKLLGEPVGLPPDEPIPATAVTLQDRDDTQCAWPVNHGVPSFLYCGATKAQGELRFCSHHAHLAYRPSRCAHA